MNETRSGSMTISVYDVGFGLVKTLPFTSEGIQAIITIIDFLETQLPPKEENEK